jgi:nitrogen fixation protein FixH
MTCKHVGIGMAVALLFGVAGVENVTAQKKSAASKAKPAVTIALKTNPTPPKTGDNTFEVTVTDAAGKPVTDADVTVALYMAAMPSMNMPAMRNSVPLKHQANGVYRGTGQVTTAGQWDATVSAKRAGKEIGSKKVKLTAK